MRYRLTIGSHEQHEVEVRYGRAMRLLRIVIDGQTAYRHAGRLPWSGRTARDFKTPGREAHTFLVEPPGSRLNHGTDPGCYVIWLDGQPLLRVER